MPIQVTCPGCLKRFQVADKFAGKQGPCPNCKKTITIPKKEDEIVIHAPVHSEAGAIGAGGQHVLKTAKRKDTKFQPLVFTAVIGFVLVALLVALVIRSSQHPPEVWLKALAAMLLGPPLAWAGYTFLRDPELEAYKGLPLIVRSLTCGLVYALLWGVYWFLGYQFFGGTETTRHNAEPQRIAVRAEQTRGAGTAKQSVEIWRIVVLIIPVFAAGTLAAFASFDLDPGSAFFHCAMYFAVTVLLRLVAGVPAVPGLGGS